MSDKEQKGKSAEEIRDQLIRDTEPVKLFVWDWLHEKGFDRDDMCLDSLEFTDVFELMRVYSQSTTEKLVKENQELREALERISDCKDKDYQYIHPVMLAKIAEQALKK